MKYLFVALHISIAFACTQVKRIASVSPSTSAPYHSLQSEADLDVLLKEIGDASVVLLGEASHGTQEYFHWRTIITQRLIEQKGFTLLAMEGDWEDFQILNKLIQQPTVDSGAIAVVLNSFHRWPTWLWNNEETFALLNWLQSYNQNKADKVKLFGLDVYSFWNGLHHLDSAGDTALRQAAKQVSNCFGNFHGDAMEYAKAVQQGKANCSNVTQNFYNLVQQRTTKDDSLFFLQQQALLTIYGERYFRTLAANRTESWNIRERYMVETVKNLLHHYGKKAKMIIWAHNTHVGDSRYVDRSLPHEYSLGELLRTEIGEDKIFSIGFGSYKGTVLAANRWNGELQFIKMIPAKKGSWEALLHDSGATNKILISREIMNHPIFNRWIEYRSYGVVNEGWTVYNRAIMPRRFNAFIYIDSTTAVHVRKQ